MLRLLLYIYRALLYQKIFERTSRKEKITKERIYRCVFRNVLYDNPHAIHGAGIFVCRKWGEIYRIVESDGFKSKYSIFKWHKETFNGSKKGSLEGDYEGS